MKKYNFKHKCKLIRPRSTDRVHIKPELKKMMERLTEKYNFKRKCKLKNTG